MRGGGALRFQAQYLRLIRVPNPTSLSESVRTQFMEAFRARDVDAATAVAVVAYDIGDRLNVGTSYLD